MPGEAFDPLAASLSVDAGSALDDLPPAVEGGMSAAGGGPGSGGQDNRTLRFVIEWGLVILIAIGVALGMRQFVVGTYFIPSESMEPTLMVGDRILVSKLSYHVHDVHRGDIVVFGRPPSEPTDIKDLVKRVIGLPGEWIASGTHGAVLVCPTATTAACRTGLAPPPTSSFTPVAQPWLTPTARISPGPPIRTQLIPAGQYFVMGDNRGDSEDSRFFGTIDRSIIVGHVVLRFWPLSQIHYFGDTGPLLAVVAVLAGLVLVIVLATWAVGRRTT